jgi:regulator of protease activity HflC (stomatin/prohibitin superfamily)
MNWVLLIIGIILVVCAVAFYIISYKEKSAKRIIGGLLLVVGLALAVVSQSFTIIPTGYTGVKTTFGQIDNVTLQNGFNWKTPLIQSIEMVDNKQQDISFNDDEIWSETKERTAIYYKGVTVTYQINPEKSSWIYANISNYKDNLVTKPLVSSAIKASSKDLSDVDATNRSIIEPKALKNIQGSLNDKYGKDVIYVNKVTINNADFEESYNKAIADKQKAQLAAEQQEIENNKAIAKAEADAKVAVEKAQGKADANEILKKSLSDEVLKDKYIEKWNGQMPNVVSDGSSVMYGIDSSSK